MTINDMMQSLGQYGIPILLFFVAVPFLTRAYNNFVPEDKGSESPHKYVYSVLVYLTSVPGIFSCVVTAYAMFILRQNLLNVNFVLYFAPIISMIATIILIRRKVDLDLVPGFDRLYGLFVTLGATFIIALIILQTRIFLFFGSSMKTFFIMIIVLFIVLKLGMRKLFKQKREE